MSKYSIKDSNTGKPNLELTIKAVENELGVCFNYRETNIISEHLDKLKNGKAKETTVAFLIPSEFHMQLVAINYQYVEIRVSFRVNDLFKWEFWHIETLL